MRFVDAHPTNQAAGVSHVTREFIRALRPVQWVKNVFVFAPLVFGMRLMHSAELGLSLIAFLFFCLISSAVYLLNDLVDRERDALHPTKKFRPIASGKLPVDVARIGLATILTLGLTGGFLFDWRVGVVLAGYFGLNTAYSFQLKQWAFIDIGCIAAGFLLRVVAGGLAISVPVSIWLLACTFLLAMFLALGKRKHEIMAVSRNGRVASTRAVLDRYRMSHVDVVLRVLAVVIVASYSLYTISADTVVQFGTSALVYTVPFVVFGMWRYLGIVAEHTETQSPTDTMVRDLPFLLNVGIWAVVVTGVIYFNQ